MFSRRGKSWENSPEAWAVLSQGVEDGVSDVGAARSTQGLQLVAAPADGDEPVIRDLLPGETTTASIRLPVPNSSPKKCYGDVLVEQQREDKPRWVWEHRGRDLFWSWAR